MLFNYGKDYENEAEDVCSRHGRLLKGQGMEILDEDFTDDTNDADF